MTNINTPILEPIQDKIYWNSRTNGLKASGAIIRNGRRILIDEEKFFNWLREYGA